MHTFSGKFIKNAQLVCKYWLYKWIKSCYIFLITSYRMTKRVEMEKDVSKRKNMPVLVWVWLQYVALDPDTFSSSSIFPDRKQSYNKPNLSKDFFDLFAALTSFEGFPACGELENFKSTWRLVKIAFAMFICWWRLILTGVFFIPAYSKWAR